MFASPTELSSFSSIGSMCTRCSQQATASETQTPNHILAEYVCEPRAHEAADGDVIEQSAQLLQACCLIVAIAAGYFLVLAWVSTFCPPGFCGIMRAYRRARIASPSASLGVTLAGKNLCKGGHLRLEWAFRPLADYLVRTQHKHHFQGVHLLPTSSSCNNCAEALCPQPLLT